MSPPVEEPSKYPPAAKPARAELVALAVILLLALLTRTLWIDRSPPGINQDEASYAWNAWCLLKTGLDQHGVAWPLLYMRLLGGNDPVMHVYALMPLQILGGMNVWTTRLTGVLLGVVTVALTWATGRRLFGAAVGLLAAALAAVDSWSIELSRMYFLAGFSPLLVLLAIWQMHRAGLPIGDATPPPSILRAAAAGALVALACYGYWAVRIFMPVFAYAAVMVELPRWLRLLRSTTGSAAAAAFGFVGLACVAPLAYEHVVRSDEIARRGGSTLLINQGNPPATVAGQIAQRYIGHFLPDFLFFGGDRYPLTHAPGRGQFAWFMAPLLILGLFHVITTCRKSISSRTLLVWLLVYPLGDSLAHHKVANVTTGESLHALRSAQGIPLFMLLGALGAARAWSSLSQRSSRAGPPVAVAFATWVAIETGAFLKLLLVDYPRDGLVFFGGHADVLQAWRWVRPRMDDADYVFCTADNVNQPYMIALFGLNYPPEQWHRDEKEIDRAREWDRCRRFGKVNFLVDPVSAAKLRELVTDDDVQKIIVIERPGAIDGVLPALRIPGPDGKPVLFVYELRQ